MPFLEPTFKPVAKVEENLFVYAPSRDKVHGYYKVKYIEQIPEPVTKDFGSLLAGASTGDTEVTDIYMNDSNIAQYRMFPLDDLELKVAQPKAKGRWLTKTVRSILSFFTGQYKATEYRHLSEIFVFEDEKVFFNVTNPTRYTQPVNRVRYIGIRYVVEKLAEKPEQYTWIPVEGA